MTIRFLQTCRSSNPHAPFQVGQVITVPHLTTEMREALEAGLAEVIPVEPEAAIVGADERAVLPRARSRR